MSESDTARTDGLSPSAKLVVQVLEDGVSLTQKEVTHYRIGKRLPRQFPRTERRGRTTERPVGINCSIGYT